MSEKPRIRVFSVDDHPLLREGIAAVIDSQADMLMVAQAATGRDALPLFREHRPDVTLMDLQTARRQRHRCDDRDPKRISGGAYRHAHDLRRRRRDSARPRRGGARYILKNMPPNELVDVIRQVHSGRKRIPQEIAVQLAEHLTDEALTPREIDVLRHVAGGNRIVTLRSGCSSRRKPSRFISNTSWRSWVRPIGQPRWRLVCDAASFSCRSTRAPAHPSSRGTASPNRGRNTSQD